MAEESEDKNLVAGPSVETELSCCFVGKHVLSAGKYCDMRFFIFRGQHFLH